MTDILAEAKRLEQERTQGGWRLAVGEEVYAWWADASRDTVIVRDDHDDDTFPIAATCDDGIPSKQNVKDAAFIAFCGTHFGALLERSEELDRLTRHDADCRCDPQSGAHVDWAHHTLCSLRREFKEDWDRHCATQAEVVALLGRLETAEEEVERLSRKPERIATPCPTCGGTSLTVGSGGHLTCSRIECSEPGVARAVKALQADRDRLAAEVERLTRLCDRNVYVRQTDYMTEVRRAEKAEADNATLKSDVERLHLFAGVERDGLQAEVARLTARWEALAGWSALPEAVNDKMDELEAQR